MRSETSSKRSLRIAAMAACLLFTVAAASYAAKEARQPKDPDPSLAPIQEDPALPRVLLIGDSISMGYTLPVRDLLKGKANLLRIPENGGPTTRGVQSIDKWLGKNKWDVIHFNWGLHDIKRTKDGKMDVAGPQQVPAEDYRKNLEALVRKLKATGAKLIWTSTTPVPEGANGRVKGEEVEANRIAKEVMDKNGVPIDDLYAYVLPHLGEYQRHADVHYLPEGYAFLAKQVAAKIIEALPPASSVK